MKIRILTAPRRQAVADVLAGPAYARAAGVTLGPILSVSESDNSAPRPVFMAMARTAKSVAGAMGQESATANVSIVWEIH